MADIEMTSVRKVYPNGYVGCDGATFRIEDGEFCVLVGPSGSGKTTLLRMIAGLEEITGGELKIAGTRMNEISPKDRDIAMVFQNYALYPHMTIYENMAFGLRLRGIPDSEIDSRVREAAQLLQLGDRLENKPKELSGGQRQRVAVGRSIVRKPKVFLFDEPLSNLDAKLRVEMRLELARLHRKLNATIVYVTHDQVEAMTLASRIIVMKDGEVQQIGTPLDLYTKPNNKFVGGFIGSPAMNFFPAELAAQGDSVMIKSNGFTLRATQDQAEAMRKKNFIGKKVIFGIRPEHIHDKLFLPDAPLDHAFNAIVDVVEPMGSETLAYLRVKENVAVVRLRGDAVPTVGTQIDLVCDMSQSHIFDAENEESIF
ncbi:TPA: glycerol-3-phosphate ABC transporter ATP-binding protein [bacterium]|nr:MAG: glycerol-3-phosphate ABC transporter ATP-binding protein [Candidatus Hydrogenedentes bacterium CG1_02_42_14]HBW47477.1 glycerol-3-phosphate ABC transporter ATP-binding protein [bacterium]